MRNGVPAMASGARLPQMKVSRQPRPLPSGQPRLLPVVAVLAIFGLWFIVTVVEIRDSSYSDFDLLLRLLILLLLAASSVVAVSPRPWGWHLAMVLMTVITLNWADHVLKAIVESKSWETIANYCVVFFSMLIVLVSGWRSPEIREFFTGRPKAKG